MHSKLVSAGLVLFSAAAVRMPACADACSRYCNAAPLLWGCQSLVEARHLAAEAVGVGIVLHNMI